jgi:hypothetical protein
MTAANCVPWMRSLHEQTAKAKQPENACMHKPYTRMRENKPPTEHSLLRV